MKNSLLIVTFVVNLQFIQAQPTSHEANDTYYRFWIGSWEVEKSETESGNFGPDSLSTMVIKPIYGSKALLEEWTLKINNTYGKSVAIRAYDSLSAKWSMYWVSDAKITQYWESKKEEETWAYYKEFTIDGKTFISRQKWFPLEKDSNRAIRTIERSEDGGNTWRMRYKTYYRRKN
jgi:hypothetical protein